MILRKGWRAVDEFFISCPWMRLTGALGTVAMGDFYGRS